MESVCSRSQKWVISCANFGSTAPPVHLFATVNENLSSSTQTSIHVPRMWVIFSPKYNPVIFAKPTPAGGIEIQLPVAGAVVILQINLATVLVAVTGTGVSCGDKVWFLSNSPRDIGNADIYLINYPNIINCSWHATLSPEIIKIHKNDIASLRK